MKNTPPTHSPNPNSPMYLLALAVGAIAFIFGAVAAICLYTLGGEDYVVGGVIVAVIVFAMAYTAILRLRGGGQ